MVRSSNVTTKCTSVWTAATAPTPNTTTTTTTDVAMTRILEICCVAELPTMPNHIQPFGDLRSAGADPTDYLVKLARDFEYEDRREDSGDPWFKKDE